MNRFVYLENNATTKLSERVKEKIKPYLNLQFGNPSNLYNFGKQVKQEITNAREEIAKFINCKAENVIFTSGGSEGNCAAINSAIKQFPNKKKIITTKIEHASILEYCRLLEQQNYNVVFLGVDSNGQLDLAGLEKEIDKDVACVSTQFANNETGIIFDIEKIKQIIEAKKKRFDFVWHIDCVQALSKIPLDMQMLNADICSFSGHKIHAPKGCGFMYIKQPNEFIPLIAGHQENNLRGGTENVIGILAIGQSIKEISENFDKNLNTMINIHGYLEEELEKIKGITINAKTSPRLQNTTSITFENINGNEVMFALERYGVCVSTGSACNSQSSEPSYVLRAMNLTKPENVIRISISEMTTKSQIDYFIENLKLCIKEN